MYRLVATVKPIQSPTMLQSTKDERLRLPYIAEGCVGGTTALIEPRLEIGLAIVPVTVGCHQSVVAIGMFTA